jgi:hypothetical protein
MSCFTLKLTLQNLKALLPDLEFTSRAITMKPELLSDLQAKTPCSSIEANQVILALQMDSQIWQTGPPTSIYLKRVMVSKLL